MNNTIKINVEDIKPFMVLSENVVSGGTVILKRDNILLGKDIALLKVNLVKDVKVYETLSTGERWIKQKKQQSWWEESAPVTETPEFKAFEAGYEDQEDIVKDSLQNISEGGSVNVKDLFAVSDGLINTLRVQSDVFSFLSYIKEKDDHTFTHSLNVALLCNVFAKWLKLSQEEIEKISCAGLIHDVGKTKIDVNILNKPGKLTDEEFAIMKTHTTLGYEAIKYQNIDEDIKLAALMHHEKGDGKGYPLGITSDKINRFAKIVSICDIYDAMTANRIYRDRICPFDVIKTFERQSYGQLDTTFLLVFLKNIAHSYLNRHVNLSDGRQGEVIFINDHNISRPIISVDGTFINLAEDRSINITSLTV